MAGSATADSVQLRELMCNRFILVQEASGLHKTQFGNRVGLSVSQVVNIARYRNFPSHEVIYRVMQEFGVSADWFYAGDIDTIMDIDMAERLVTAQTELGLRAE